MFRKRKKTLLFYIGVYITILCSGCSNYNILTARYILTTDENQINAYHQETREVTHFNHNMAGANGTAAPMPVTQTVSSKAVLNKAIFIPVTLFNNTDIIQVIGFLDKGRESKAARYINKIDQNSRVYNFLKGVSLFYKADYINAKAYFQKNNHPDLDIMSEIMIVDCLFESQKLAEMGTAIKTSKKTFIDYYQDVVDRYDLDDNYVKLINNRAKLIRL